MCMQLIKNRSSFDWYRYYIRISIMQNASLNLYNLGVHLRTTYGNFLGDSFRTQITRMRTTEYVSSMLSAQLVNAGLWPPSDMQTWTKDINWQPVPTGR